MATKSVVTKFSTTPEEQIFGVDPFKAVSSTTLNNIVSKSGGFGGGLANLLGVAGDVAATAGVISFIASGKLDKDYIVNKLGSSLKIDTTFLSKTPIANAGKLLQSMGLVDEKTANMLTGKDSSMSLVDIYTTAHNGYKATVANVKKVGDGFENMGKSFEKYLKDDLFDSFTSFTSAITSLNPELANLVKAMGLGEELTLLTSLVGQTVDLGIPGLIDLIVQDIKDVETQRAVLAQSLGPAINASNMEVLNSAIDILGANVLRGLYPNLVSDILKSYRSSADTINLTVAEREAALMTILNRIDKRWYYTERNGKDVLNLDVFRSLSTESKDILTMSANPLYQQGALLGNMFKPEAPLVVAKKYYPYI